MMTYYEYHAESIAMILMLEKFSKHQQVENWYIQRKQKIRHPKLSDFTNSKAGWL